MFIVLRPQPWTANPNAGATGDRLKEGAAINLSLTMLVNPTP